MFFSLLYVCKLVSRTECLCMLVSQTDCFCHGLKKLWYGCVVYINVSPICKKSIQPAFSPLSLFIIDIFSCITKPIHLPNHNQYLLLPNQITSQTNSLVYDHCQNASYQTKSKAISFFLFLPNQIQSLFNHKNDIVFSKKIRRIK